VRLEIQAIGGESARVGGRGRNVKCGADTPSYCCRKNSARTIAESIAGAMRLTTSIHRHRTRIFWPTSPELAINVHSALPFRIQRSGGIRRRAHSEIKVSERVQAKNFMATCGQPTIFLGGRSNLLCGWVGSALRTETTFHQLSPYIGKVKSSMAASLVSRFTSQGDLVYDPFSGSGTIALEAWLAGRRVLANDISPYASTLTRAKMFPCRCLEDALSDIDHLSGEADKLRDAIDLRSIPRWVRRFFHPETLREALAWTRLLRTRRRWFLLASLLGILHHQRPGFLSFPSSHTVPYLREKKFPRHRFPALYAYRSVRDRLESKVKRAFRRVPNLDFGLARACACRDAGTLAPMKMVDSIITSPPYMRQLDYGRDNRLRLWFLGAHDWRSLDAIASPSEGTFLSLMRRCFTVWRKHLKPDHFCILVMGNACSRNGREDLPEVVCRIATDEIGGYTLELKYTEAIPNERRVRRGIVGSTSETILVLRNRRTRDPA